MVFREVSVIEIREALRAWLAGKSERAVAARGLPIFLAAILLADVAPLR